MIYNLTSSTGSIVVAPATTINYKDLQIIGRDSLNWNLPIQQNFVTLVDKVESKADLDIITAIETKVDSVYDYAGFEAAFEEAK